jgi:hypothetical protein
VGRYPQAITGKYREKKLIKNTYPTSGAMPKELRTFLRTVLTMSD